MLVNLLGKDQLLKQYFIFELKSPHFKKILNKNTFFCSIEQILYIAYLISLLTKLFKYMEILIF